MQGAEQSQEHERDTLRSVVGCHDIWKDGNIRLHQVGEGCRATPLKLVREEDISSAVLIHSLVMAHSVQRLARQPKFTHALIEHQLPLL